MVFIAKWSSLCAIAMLTSTYAWAGSIPDSLQSRSSLAKRSLPNFANFGSNPEGLEKITQAFKDMEKMVSACLKADTATFNKIHGHWFPENSHNTVRSILEAMVNPPSTDGTGSTTLSQITVDNNDPNKICETFETAAYAINASPEDGLNDAVPLTIHFCEAPYNAYALPALSKITCTDLDKFLSVKMQTLGGYALVHELSHVEPISGAAIKPLKIALPNQSLTCKATEDFVYGPQQCQSLLTNKDDSMKALANADNYGWFVTELYWTLECKFDYGPPESNIMVPGSVCNEPKRPCSIR